MNVQKFLKLAHTSSILISLIINGLLVFALLMFVTFTDGMDRDLSQVMVIDPEEAPDIDEPEPEIDPEEVLDPQELDDLVDFTLDTEMQTDFDQETEVVDNVTETDVSALSELMSDVSSPVVMTGLLEGRTTAARQAASARYGRGYERFSEPAVVKALEWLRDHQHENGAWQKDGNVTGGGYNTGYTGLALLTFLAHGETPSSAEFGPTVARAIRFLVENQAADGTFQPAGGHTVYGHAMATYALAEAYTMTGNVLLREPLERGVQRIMDGIQPNGGFNYQYRKDDRNDLSVGGWHVQALKAATIALPDDEKVREYLDRAMDGMLAGSGRRDGGRFFTYAYTNPNNIGGPQLTVSAAGSLGLYLSGRHRSREARESIGFLERLVESDNLPAWSENEGIAGDINRWYYAIQAFFHEDPDGRNFRRYMPSMVRALAQNQAEEGYWLHPSDRGISRGKVFNTTLGALGLMVYYRYLPTTQVENIRETVTSGPDDVSDPDEVGFEI